MRSRFPLFQSHLDLAHFWWERLVQPGDHVIDATMGNGHDTLTLAQLALRDNSGELWALDVQPQALEKTKLLCQSQLSSEQMEKVHLLEQCHSQLPGEESSVQLVVYNLGYLPGADKSRTTLSETTLQSLSHALRVVRHGGAISITCYPGHEAGAVEESALLEWSESLDPRQWNVCHHRWGNRRNAPSLLLIQREIERE